MEEIKYNIVSTSVKGRCLLAARDLAEGEVILEDKPIVACQFSWNKDYLYEACDYCLFPLETAEHNIRRLAANNSIALPYLECDNTQEVVFTQTACPECKVKYCNENCLMEAEEKYHKSLCLGNEVGNLNHPLNALNELWKKMHYPPETCTIKLIVRMLGMIKQAKNKDELIKKFGEFCDSSVNDDLMICHKLLGVNFERQLNELHGLLMNAFENDQDLAKFLTPEGFRSIFALIGTNGQGIGTSSFAAWVKNVEELQINETDKNNVDELIDDLYAKLEETAGQFLNNEGSGLYSLQSKINHSCSPNAEIRFPHSNHILQVVALKPINKDEEICISYLDECVLERSRYSRQKYLQENYLFLCECEKCKEQIEDPNQTSEEEECSDEDEEMD